MGHYVTAADWDGVGSVLCHRAALLSLIEELMLNAKEVGAAGGFELRQNDQCCNLQKTPLLL